MCGKFSTEPHASFLDLHVGNFIMFSSLLVNRACEQNKMNKKGLKKSVESSHYEKKTMHAWISNNFWHPNELVFEFYFSTVFLQVYL